MSTEKLSEEQLSALREFSKSNGKKWKAKLFILWSNGYNTRGSNVKLNRDHIPLLQQIRNNVACANPTWLVDLKDSDLMDGVGKNIDQK